MFIAALFTTAKIWKQTKSPAIDKWVRNIWNVYTMGYFSAVRKEKILLFGMTWMDLKGIMLNEISQINKSNTLCS